MNKWRKKNTDGFGRVNLTIGGIINRLEIEFRDIALEVFDKFKEEQMYLFRYDNSVRGTGKDAAQKLNDWLDKNTKRNSFLTWEYKGKIYKGIDELRRIWQNEIDKHYA